MSGTIGARVSAAVDARFDESLDFLVRLVREPSLLGGVRPAQELIFRRLSQMGLSARIEDLPVDAIAGHPDYAPVPWSSSGQPNVWGVLPGAGGGRSLALNGHIDVVPPDPVDWWSRDPWGGEIDGGRMFGRGALDMKSGLVAGLLAIQAVLDCGIERRGTIIFESVIEEECTGNGMLAQRAATGPVDGAVILEPTGETIWSATPGVLWFTVQVIGKAAYVGQPSALVNAVETAADLIGRLKAAIPPALNAAFDHPAFRHLENPLTLNIGRIEGGAWPSSVPLESSFTCRMAYPIGWTFAEARAFVEERVRAIAGANPWLAEHPPRVRFEGFRALPWEGDPDSELNRQLGAAHLAETGEPLRRTVFPGTADARYFGSGEAVTYYGPAGGGIHGPDEFVEIESVRRTARTLARFIAEWCA
jgi:acetylornithine deacetylase